MQNTDYTQIEKHTLTVKETECEVLPSDQIMIDNHFLWTNCYIYHGPKRAIKLKRSTVIPVSLKQPDIK